MSPTVEDNILLILNRIESKQDEHGRELSEVKGKVISLDAAHKQSLTFCHVTHKRVDERLDELEDAKEVTDVHDREVMQKQIDEYRSAHTHWRRYLLGALITAATGGLGWLIHFAMTHR